MGNLKLTLKGGKKVNIPVSKSTGDAAKKKLQGKGVPGKDNRKK